MASLAGLVLGHVLVQQDGLADLVADRVHRAQGRHRLLEDHADQPAPNLVETIVLLARR